MSLARKMARKAAKKAAKQPPPTKTPQIQLQNPVAEFFPAFIIGNAPHCDRVVEEDSAKGQHLVLCGAGPSLAENAREYITDDVDQVWGCNSAMPWLKANGYKVTHAITVDQTPQMVSEWMEAGTDVKYLVASTIHPHLTEHLLARGCELTWFHNFVGIQRPPVKLKDDGGKDQLMSYEDWLYVTLYPNTCRAGAGLNTLNRALDVAQVMGFEKITVLGADCAIRTKSEPPPCELYSPEYMAWLRENTVMHADGGNALASESSPLTMHAVIDSGTVDDTVREGHGRLWVTKIDMAVSGLWLVRVARKHPHIQLVGDTFPNAIFHKSEAFLSRLPTMTDPNGVPLDLSVL